LTASVGRLSRGNVKVETFGEGRGRDVSRKVQEEGLCPLPLPQFLVTQMISSMCCYIHNHVKNRIHFLLDLLSRQFRINLSKAVDFVFY